MHPTQTRCLILACGNTLRSDDGVGPFLAAWAEERFRTNPDVRAIARHQWTPELAENIAAAQTVLFIDCAIGPGPGNVSITEVHPAPGSAEIATHHLGAPELLALSRDLFDSLPRRSLLLTVGAGSTELGEQFSDAVTAALPCAQHLLETTLRQLLG